MSSEVEVLIDPRLDVSADDLRLRFETLQRAGAMQETVVDAMRRIDRLRTDVDLVLAKLKQRKDDAEEGTEADGQAQGEAEGEADGQEESTEEEESPETKLKKAGKELLKALDESSKSLVGFEDEKGIRRDDDQVFPSLRQAYFAVANTWEAPPAVLLNYIDRAEHALAEALPELNRLLSESVPTFREQVEALDLRLLPAMEPLAMPGAAED